MRAEITRRPPRGQGKGPASARRTIWAVFATAAGRTPGRNEHAAGRTLDHALYVRRLRLRSRGRAASEFFEAVPDDRNDEREEEKLRQHGTQIKKERRPGCRTAASFSSAPIGTESTSVGKKRLAPLLRLLLRGLLRGLFRRSSHRISPRSPAPICRRHQYSAIVGRCNCPATITTPILFKGPRCRSMIAAR